MPILLQARGILVRKTSKSNHSDMRGRGISLQGFQYVGASHFRLKHVQQN
jgi:hypothetical protein